METTNESKLNILTNYETAVKWMRNNIVLCNEIANLDPSIFDNICDIDTDEYEDEEYPEIYQYYITDCTDRDVDFLRAHFSGLHFSYSDMLGKYILLVTHWGTSWDYVTTYTDLPCAERKNK